ncbi:spore coat protein CotJB [Paenibacillus tyrfis]|uniref:CotJB protein n=1 Tax=Paenibacillus tyrfis TaxID=1501230 RepID=A0A081P4B7_9BACL|nr:spore coat protein CotJB [Paenibacillus tyrfis]KEQ25540.1 cotJB protein [Paenibacillus tyrfis]
MKQPLPPHYYTLLEELQAIDFVLVELTLYLDTHPEDAQALEQFNQCAQQRQLLAGRYESEFGPLLQFGHSYSGYPWQWVESPWPWQV